MSFNELGLDHSLVRAVEHAGYHSPTEVQRRAIPAALAGRDLLVSSHTGSGKTAAFLLPCLHRLTQPAKVAGIGPRILVLTPTRELALQVQQGALTYGRQLRRMRTIALVGGTPYGQQLRDLRSPVDVAIATPGRLIDHLERGRIDFSRLEVLIFDEADRMLDMGFIDDIETIVRRCPSDRQTLLFSATLEGVVGDMARRMTREPERIEVAGSVQNRAQIDQKLLFADDMGHKAKLLKHILKDEGLQQAVVFTATKRAAEELSEELRNEGFAAAALHGDMHQSLRNRTLEKLRHGRTTILVATDVAARGIDVAGISHVINFDAPRQAEDYVHRIGRTGRAGRSGIAFTLAGHTERGLIRNIERYTNSSLAVETIPGLEPTAPPPRPRRSGPRPGGGGGYRGAPRRGGGGGAPRRDGFRPSNGGQRSRSSVE